MSSDKTSIACIALWKNKVLVAHRNPTGQMGGRWEFPGGKVEDGETEIQAVQREFMEEFGVKVLVGDKIGAAVFEHNEKKVDLICYRIYVPHKGILRKYRLTEHTGYRWVKLDKIQHLDFVDSDLLLYPQVKEYVEKL